MTNNDKSYLLFSGDQCCPLGGFHDFIGAYPTLEKAEKAAFGEWAQICLFSNNKLRLIKRGKSWLTKWNEEGKPIIVWKWEEVNTSA